MKKIFLFCLVIITQLFILESICYAEIITNSGVQRLERKLFDETYENETYEERLSRLENKLFGATQAGNLDNRYITLRSAAKNYKSFNPYYQNPYYNPNYYRNHYGNYQNPLFTGTTGSSWKTTVLNNFRNQFIGTPTGLTPAMDPAYMDWFEAERAMSGEQRYYRTNKGYKNSNTNRGTSASVTILD